MAVAVFIMAIKVRSSKIRVQLQYSVLTVKQKNLRTSMEFNWEMLFHTLQGYGTDRTK